MNKDYEAMKRYMDKAENFITHNGIKVKEISDGYCEVEAELTKWSMNPQGAAHGSLIYGLIDVATGVASSTTGRFILTLDASIRYLRQGKGKKLRGTGRRIKEGKTIGVYEGNVYDDEGRLVAKGDVTVFYAEGNAWYRMEY